MLLILKKIKLNLIQNTHILIRHLYLNDMGLDVVPRTDDWEALLISTDGWCSLPMWNFISLYMCKRLKFFSRLAHLTCKLELKMSGCVWQPEGPMHDTKLYFVASTYMDVNRLHKEVLSCTGCTTCSQQAMHLQIRCRIPEIEEGQNWYFWLIDEHLADLQASWKRRDLWRLRKLIR